MSWQVSREARALEVLDAYSGPGRVAGFTVLHGRGQEPRGVALVTTSTGQRTLATTAEPALIARMQVEEFVGRDVQVHANEVTL